MFRLYGNLMRKHPFVTQCVTSGCLAALGDVIAQVCIVKKERFNYFECFRFFAVGSCFIAPVARTWYIALDKIIVPSSKLVAVKKTFLDQVMYAPPFLAAILGTLRVLDGDSPKAAYDAIKRDYMRVLIANWKVWPFIQMANFYFVPLNYQVIVVNATAVVWNSYLAYVAEQKETPSSDIVEQLPN